MGGGGYQFLVIGKFSLDVGPSNRQFDGVEERLHCFHLVGVEIFSRPVTPAAAAGVSQIPLSPGKGVRMREISGLPQEIQRGLCLTMNFLHPVQDLATPNYPKSNRNCSPS